MDLRSGGISYRGRLEPPRPETHLIAADVSAAGGAAGLWATGAGAQALTETPAPRRRRPAWAPDPVDIWITITDADSADTTTIISAQTRHLRPRIALTGDGLLLAGAAATRTPSGPHPNGTRLDLHGRTKAEGMLGDGIACLTALADGRVAVGYSDALTGGHRADPASRPAKGAGLLIVDDDFTAEITGTDTPPPVACTAMTADETGALWYTHHRGNPVVRLHGGQARAWPNHTVVQPALIAALDESRVVFYGGLDPRHGRRRGACLTACRLTDRVEAYATWWPRPAPGNPLAHLARGSTLHRIGTDGTWHSLDLRALDEAGDRR